MSVLERIEEHLAGWPGPFTADDVFGTHDAAEIARDLERFCARELGSSPRRALFHEASVGCVFGVELEDGRRVVVKAHQQSESEEHLSATSEVQRELARRGFPCPRPLLGPRPIGFAPATVEELVDRGARVEEYEQACGRTFSPAERVRLAAAAAYGLAYRGRCEACGDPAAREFPPGSVRKALALHGDDYLLL